MDVHTANVLFGLVMKLGKEYANDWFVVSSAIYMYAELSCLSKVRRIFDNCLERNIEMWNSMIGGSCQIHICSSFSTAIWRSAIDCGIEVDPTMKFLDEKLSPIDSPYKKDALYLKESQGHLYFIEFDSYDNYRKFHVYELEKNCFKWFLKYQIDLDDLCRRATTHIWDEDEVNFPLLLSLDNGNVEENSALLLLCIPGQIISYKLKDKIYRKLCDFNINVHQYKYL